MAERKSFPMLPGKQWWTLRDKFKQSMPGVVTDSYLAAALNMQARSARGNVLPYLKDIGLIDEEGKIQELAKAWRDDHQYADVCKKIRDDIYPDELLSAAPNPSADRGAAQRWFAMHTGAGRVAVQRMITFYTIIVEADVTKQKDKKKPKATQKKGTTRPKKAEAKLAVQEKSVSPVRTQATQSASPVPSPQGMPGVSINLEIHISADASPDQIDKIFESMAKHIYGK